MYDPYDEEIYSAELLGLTNECPECDGMAHGTGFIRHRRSGGAYPWVVEYKCDKGDLVFMALITDEYPIIKEIVRKAGKQ
jgi:hypothetical protein